MNYMVILIAFALFLSSMFLHVIIWRVVKPRHLVRALFIVLLPVPALAVFLIVFYVHPQSSDGLLISDWLGVLLMHFSFASAYILSYPAIQAKCPSLTMLLLIKDSEREGSTMEDFSRVFSDESIRDSRLDDLVNDSMVATRDNEYYITAKGTALLWPLMILRRLLGLPSGEG